MHCVSSERVNPIEPSEFPVGTLDNLYQWVQYYVCMCACVIVCMRFSVYACVCDKMREGEEGGREHMGKEEEER